MDERERELASGKELRRTLEIERDRTVAELASLTRERDAARADVAHERDESARAREEAALVRADTARQIQAAGERESALTARASQLEATLDALRRSRVVRLATPWWKLKAFLSR